MLTQICMSSVFLEDVVVEMNQNVHLRPILQEFVQCCLRVDNVLRPRLSQLGVAGQLNDQGSDCWGCRGRVERPRIIPRICRTLG